MKKIGYIFFFIFLSLSTIQGQNTDFAASANYNFQSGGTGADVRVLLPVHRSLFFVARLSYFPSFNDIHEFYLGGDLTKFIANIRGLNPYIFIGMYYNDWINSQHFNNAKATKQNTTAEPGFGVLFYKGCINPYLETRYSTRWKECTISAGILLHIGDCFGSRKSNSPWLCPNF